MTCTHGPEIKSQLLTPRYRMLLQSFIDRWKSDPKFLVYHQASTILILRRALGFPHASEPRCAACDCDRLMECRMAEVLKEAMEERIAEQEMKIAS